MGDIVVKPSGSGADSSELTANRDDVLKGKTAVTHDSDGDPITGTLELTGNVSAADMLAGKTGYSNNPKEKIIGTMHNGYSVDDNGKIGWIQNDTKKVYVRMHQGAYFNYPNGDWPATSVQFSELANAIKLTGAKLLKGQTILDIAGTATSDANAAAAELLSSKTAYVNGNKITGTMPNRGAPTYTLPINGTQNLAAGYYSGGKVTQSVTTQGAQTIVPSTSNKSVAANRWLTGAQTISGDPNLVAANIKKNVTIFGVKGTHSGYVVTPQDLYLRGQNPYGFTVSGSGVIFDSGQITINSDSDSYTNRDIYSPTAINFSQYSRLRVECSLTANQGQGGANPTSTLAVSRLPGSDLSWEQNILASSRIYNNATSLTLDISNVNATGYVIIGEFSTSYAQYTGAIYRIWLE